MWIMSSVIRCNLRDISEVSSIVIPSVAAKYRRSWETLFSELQRGPQWLHPDISVHRVHPYLTQKMVHFGHMMSHESTMNQPWTIHFWGSSFRAALLILMESEPYNHQTATIYVWFLKGSLACLKNPTSGKCRRKVKMSIYVHLLSIFDSKDAHHVDG